VKKVEAGNACLKVLSHRIRHRTVPDPVRCRTLPRGAVGRGGVAMSGVKEPSTR